MIVIAMKLVQVKGVATDSVDVDQRRRRGTAEEEM
jgi:hypothetical protein